MCNAVGHPVLKLFRQKVGPITIGRLKPGEYRELTTHELSELKKIIGMS
jgi:16S rRNA U516 pseudouridylate synthase RsuA-like enzyme